MPAGQPAPAMTMHLAAPPRTPSQASDSRPPSPVPSPKPPLMRQLPPLEARRVIGSIKEGSTPGEQTCTSPQCFGVLVPHPPACLRYTCTSAINVRTAPLFRRDLSPSSHSASGDHSAQTHTSGSSPVTPTERPLVKPALRQELWVSCQIRARSGVKFRYWQCPRGHPLLPFESDFPTLGAPETFDGVDVEGVIVGDLLFRQKP